ncbi:2-phosphosulfolactate phosphatase [Halobacillus salinus]|uniref:Probable 2-phosphosulfolactate phosphatase n=1 Tax=Halobacillus salinus TaxID=192814 RepID=A0A4Z0H0B3_9BACI|nr:2-phosphosulfolactate phosphatase [Halobacillus salinus]TGB03892.1 2-phosphosulfolactate phosphatase [Halobacillus salinus]
MANIHLIFKKEDIKRDKMVGKVAIVFDVLFATSTITAALADGARSVIPVLDQTHGREKAKEMRESYLLAGEDKGRLIEGFHPPIRPHLKDVVRDQTLILSTTNGTVALQNSSEADVLYACSLLNNEAMADHLNKHHNDQDLVMVCSGSSGHYTLEDFFGAGSLIHHLVKKKQWSLSDGAKTALLFYNGNEDHAAELLSQSKIGSLLLGAGMEQKEIDFVAQEGLWNTIPVYDRVEGKIKEWSYESSEASR